MDTQNADQIKPKKRRNQKKKVLMVVDDMTGKEVAVPYWKHLYGAEPKNVKIRSCLKCQTRFPSAGPQNRLCNPCNLMIESKSLNFSEDVSILHNKFQSTDTHYFHAS